MDEHSQQYRACEIKVEGRVQGVGFRYSAVHAARRFRVTGWVRNLPDGRVEVLAEGEEQRVGQLLAWCRQGPPHSRVDHIEEFTENYSGGYATFSITL